MKNKTKEMIIGIPLVILFTLGWLGISYYLVSKTWIDCLNNDSLAADFYIMGVITTSLIISGGFILLLNKLIFKNIPLNKTITN